MDGVGLCHTGSTQDMQDPGGWTVGQTARHVIFDVCFPHAHCAVCYNIYVSVWTAVRAHEYVEGVQATQLCLRLFGGVRPSGAPGVGAMVILWIPTHK